ncbi:alpha-amylase family glycosyl hydrolase [Insolitispirillum peregrinum]|uniref:alpha-amylase family glycosyl hydrolase n=1 Tax=Insolitispirillum peregrinum TaxID=80876 RepID=UPI003606B94C
MPVTGEDCTMSEAVGLRAPRIYNLFPPLTGSIPDWSRHILRVRDMGFNWIYINPFHYPGFSGSLYAVKDYYRLNPMLRGPAYASDDDLLRGFIESAGSHGLSVIMDLVINHTSRDSALVHEHPDWFQRDPDGNLVSPCASHPDDPDKRTVWGDLAALDYRPRPQRAALVGYFCSVVRHYARLGMRAFRCDAAHRIPADVWLAIMAAAHQENPDILFFAETLGCTPDEVEALRPARFDYLFNSSKWWDGEAPWLLDHYEQFRDLAPSVSFPESHDTARLAAETEASGVSSVKLIAEVQRYRYLFSAMFSSAVMMPMGYEFGFTRPMNVVTSRPEQWENARFDISPYVAEVNRLKASLSVLNREGPQQRLASPSGAYALLRRNNHGAEWVLTVINPPHNGTACLALDRDPIGRRAACGIDVTPAFPAGGSTADLAVLVLRGGEIRVFTGTTEPEEPLADL